jgi:hypothetical protein
MRNRFLSPKCNFWLSRAQMRRADKPYFEYPLMRGETVYF